MSACSGCGYLNPDNAKFCQQCGAPLAPPIATEQVFEAPLGVETSAKKRLTDIEKVVLVSAILVIVLIIGVFASLSYNPSRTAPAPTQAPSWHTVSTYLGGFTDSYNTTLFDIKGTQFRLRWSFTTNYPYNIVFAVYDYPPLSLDPSHGSPLPVICQTSDTTTASYGCNYTTTSSNSGTKNLSQGPGTFYLQIISSVTGWTVTVEDYY